MWKAVIVHDCFISLKGKIWAHKTSLTLLLWAHKTSLMLPFMAHKTSLTLPFMAHKTSMTLPLFIDVPVPNQEYQSVLTSCRCLTQLSTIFRLYCGG